MVGELCTQSVANKYRLLRSRVVEGRPTRENKSYEEHVCARQQREHQFCPRTLKTSGGSKRHKLNPEEITFERPDIMTSGAQDLSKSQENLTQRGSDDG